MVMNLAGIIQGLITPDCSHYEADTRIIIHVLNCLKNGVMNVFVKTNDTDVVVLLTAYLPKFLEHGDVNIVAVCGIGNTSYLSINQIGNYIGLHRCPELLFLHSISGCDYTSSFFKVGKIKFWDQWLENNNISPVFRHMSYCPVLPIAEGHLQTIEKFVISVYDRSLEVDMIDSARFEIFKYKGDFDFRALPPTSNALRLHIHRAALVGCGACLTFLNRHWKSHTNGVGRKMMVKLEVLMSYGQTIISI